VQTLVIASTLLLSTGAIGPTAMDAPAPMTCEGLQATVIAGPEEHAVGTDGDDVIVVDRAWSVDAKAGNDRVCVVTLAGDRTAAIAAGSGDDRVLVLSTNERAGVSADLGAGADVFLGGVTRDHLTLRDAVDDDVDQISTGANDDLVTVGGDAEVADDIDLGPGDDGLYLNSSAAAGHRFVGGPGVDVLRPALPEVAGLLVVDNALEKATHSGSEVLTWDGFEQFTVGTRDRPVVFIGGPRGEWLSTDGLVRATMGGGDDTVSMGALLYAEADTPQATPVVIGGSGRDLYIQAVQDDVTVEGWTVADLARGTISSRLNGINDLRRLSGIEDLRIYGDVVTVRGDARANRVEAFGCSVTVNGRAGADTLASPARRENHNGCRRGLTFRGGAGDDIMMGRQHGDTLLGGRGKDRAVGRSGRDLCRAEVRLSCELR
jgi:Ca2+-binding RTX toxin-like protein